MNQHQWKGERFPVVALYFEFNSSRSELSPRWSSRDRRCPCRVSSLAFEETGPGFAGSIMQECSEAVIALPALEISDDVAPVLTACRFLKAGS
jgi:hypothetical protein